MSGSEMTSQMMSGSQTASRSQMASRSEMAMVASRVRGMTRLASVVEIVTTQDAARLGRWLMIFCAGAVACTGWYVDDRDPYQFGHWVPLVAGAMLALAVASARMPWDRLPRRTALLYPLSALTALAAVGVLAPTAGPAYVPMFTLWFMFIGVTQKARTGWLVAPLAALAWLVINAPIGPQRVVRLGLTLIVWVLLADMLAVRAQQVAERTEDLCQQASTDPLTGLANRRTLERELGAMTAGDLVVVLDIDRFKRVNDTLGHDGGDRVLVDLAVTLTSVVRSGDLVARFGGEEFVLLLRRPHRTAPFPPHRTATGAPAAVATVPHGAGPVMERLRDSWRLLHPDITWSAGVCALGTGMSPAQALSLADRALFAAKRAGRDRVVTHRAGLPTSEPVPVG